MSFAQNCCTAFSFRTPYPHRKIPVDFSICYHLVCRDFPFFSRIWKIIDTPTFLYSFKLWFSFLDQCVYLLLVKIGRISKSVKTPKKFSGLCVHNTSSVRRYNFSISKVNFFRLVPPVGKRKQVKRKFLECKILLWNFVSLISSSAMLDEARNIFICLNIFFWKKISNNNVEILCLFTPFFFGLQHIVLHLVEAFS